MKEVSCPWESPGALPSPDLDFLVGDLSYKEETASTKQDRHCQSHSITEH